MMLILILGGSGSGKSAYAEEYTQMLSDGCRMYYIATMQVYGEEGRKKVQRHRKMREGKGFVTIEQQADLEFAAGKADDADGVEKVALLECMSNLTANEMFAGEVPKCCEYVAEKIMQGVESLRKVFRHLVIVSNNVFEDGVVYDDTTTEYIRVMGTVNQKLAEQADKVIEVVVGIPLVVKEGN